MAIDRQYYGLVSALPALQLSKCPAPPWDALWQQSAAYVSADTQTLLAGLYLHYEHLPLLLGRLPYHHPYPAQQSIEQLSALRELRLPYVAGQSLLDLRQQPLAIGLAALQRAWEDWIRGFEVPLLLEYLDFSKELAQYRLQWQASEQDTLRDLLREQALPGLSQLEDALEQRLLPGALQQLVHSSNSFDETRHAEQLLWRWLEDRVFHEQFSLNALIAYALRQQLSWQWYVAPNFSATTMLTSTVNQMLA